MNKPILPEVVHNYLKTSKLTVVKPLCYPSLKQTRDLRPSRPSHPRRRKAQERGKKRKKNEKGVVKRGRTSKNLQLGPLLNPSRSSSPNQRPNHLLPHQQVESPLPIPRAPDQWLGSAPAEDFWRRLERRQKLGLQADLEKQAADNAKSLVVLQIPSHLLHQPRRRLFQLESLRFRRPQLLRLNQSLLPKVVVEVKAAHVGEVVVVVEAPVGLVARAELRLHLRRCPV